MTVNKGQESGSCINLLLKSEFNRIAVSASLFPLKNGVSSIKSHYDSYTEGLFLLSCAQETRVKILSYRADPAES